MGLFGKLYSGIKSGFKNVVEKGVEVIKSIAGALSYKVSEEKAYDKTTGSVNNTVNINELLVEFGDKCRDSAERYEYASIREVDIFFENLISILNTDELNDTIGIKMLRKEKNNVTKKIKGSLVEIISRRISLQDAECSRILKMDSGNSKKYAMNEFTRKILNNAMDNLIYTVKSSVDSASEMMINHLKDLSNERKTIIESNLKQFNEAIENYAKEEFDKEDNIPLPLFKIEAINEISKILD